MSDEATSQATVEKPPDRYIFSAHVIGAAAHCHTLDNEKVKSTIQVPALAPSVLPAIGGLSRSEVSNFCLQIPYPTTRRSLLSVHRIKTRAEGTIIGKQYRTEIDAEVESITFADKLHIDSARLHILSTREALEKEPYFSEPTVSTKNRITGIHLGAATIQVDLDDDLLPKFPTSKHIEADLERACQNKIRRYRGNYFFSLVKNILVVNQDREVNKIEQVAPNAVHWDGFGTIFFGEAIVKNDDRLVTLVRVEMDAEVEGSGTVGPGSSNGSAGST
jgi:hypothetical protein